VSKVRILYVVGQLAGGGLERQLGYLLKAMDRDRFQPKVAVWNFDEEDVNVQRIRALGVELIAIPRGGSRLVWFRRLASQLAPEVVHSYSFFTNVAAHFAGTSPTRVGSIRADFLRDRASTGPVLGRFCARWPRCQVCNSSAAASLISRSKSIFKPQRVFFVRNALDLAQFPVHELLSTGIPLILGIGSLMPFKRWDSVIKLGLELANRRIPARIQIVGDGPDRGRLQSLINRLELQDSVKLLGYQYNISRVLAGASLVVHASSSEGYPNAIMEAMACGRPVVATDAGDSSHLIEGGSTGYIVGVGDDGALIERVVELIMNPDLMREMGAAARKRAELMFGPERLVRETLDVYRSLGWMG
jgi:glycosyltransferase involved in cell wall biosynthesis